MHHTFHQHITIGIYTICSYVTLIACLLFLISCGQPLAGTTTSTPTKANIPTTVSGKAVLFERLRMFNVSTGWAVTHEPSHSCRLLHTTAGVTQWQGVTPATGSKDCSIDGTDFFDSFVAWIAVDTTPNLFIYHTYDGGQTWRKTQLPDQGNRVDHLFFLDKQIGWLLVDKAAAASREAVDILKTSDGGATWKIISVSDSSTVNNPTAIPFEGDKSGLTFVSMTTGWITAFTAKDHFPWLYVTHDGGVIPIRVQIDNFLPG